MAVHRPRPIVPVAPVLPVPSPRWLFGRETAAPACPVSGAGCGLAPVLLGMFRIETFSGEVVCISPRAEFTPANVQAGEGRSSIVFAVRLEISNGGLRLKPGMPADAAIRIR